MKMLQGFNVSAEYISSLIVRYRNNPIIESLPEIFSVEQAKARYLRLPPYDNNERNLPAHLRLHCVQVIKQYVFPSSRVLNLEQCISRMIREGYVSRNPLDTEYVKRLHNGYSEIMGKNAEHELMPLLADSCAIIGVPGVGKTTATEHILLSYPQIIRHTECKGKNFPHTQVVWLKLDCPHDGSIKGLCLAFFQAMDSILDTSYYQRFNNYTTDKLLLHINQVASLYNLGLLVIDEVQNLCRAKSGGAEKMINFFVQLINTIGLPVLIIGNPKALPFVDAFRPARRVTGQTEVIWSPVARGKEWDLFLSHLWVYQWTKKESPLTEELNKLIFDESQGILDVAVKLYMLSQWRAITTGLEEITTTLVRSVSKDCLSMLKPMLRALRNNNTKFLQQYQDIYIPMDRYFQDYQLELSAGTSLEEQSDLGYKVAQIAQWLIQAGIGEETAFKSANMALRNKNPEDDEKTIRTKAFTLAIGQQCNYQDANIEQSIKQKSKQKPKRKNNSKNITKEPAIYEGDIKKLPA